MSRRTRATHTETAPPTGINRAAYWALNLPRLGRVLLVALFGVATTLALMPVIDAVYITHLMALGVPVLPALVSTGIGMAIYVAGWRLVVGTVGESPVLGRATTLYVWLGVLMCLFVLALVTYGLVLNAQQG